MLRCQEEVRPYSLKMSRDIISLVITNQFGSIRRINMALGSFPPLMNWQVDFTA
jgi:hypothetical protein